MILHKFVHIDIQKTATAIAVAVIVLSDYSIMIYSIPNSKAASNGSKRIPVIVSAN